MGSPRIIFSGEVYADHWHVFLADAEAGFCGPEFEEAYQRRLGAGRDWIRILTAVYATVQLTIELGAGPPMMASSGWDHVAEASLALPSGLLQIGNDESDHPPVAVPPGSYRVRVHYGNITHAPDDLDNPYGEHYRVVMWPAPPAAPMVLRQGPTWGHRPGP